MCALTKSFRPSRISVFLCFLFYGGSLLLSAAKAETPEFDSLFIKLKEEEDKESLLMKRLLSQSKEIAKTLQAMNRAVKDFNVLNLRLAKVPVRSGEIRRTTLDQLERHKLEDEKKFIELYSVQPTMFYDSNSASNWKNWLFLETQANVMDALNRNISAYKEIEFSQCFNRDTRSFNDTESCLKKAEARCGAFQIRDKKLYLPYFDKALNRHDIEIDSWPTYMSVALKEGIWFGRPLSSGGNGGLAACQLMALVAKPTWDPIPAFPGTVALSLEKPIWATGLYEAPESQEELEAACLSADLDATRAKLLSIVNLPDSSSQKPLIEEALRQLNRRIENCGIGTGLVCENISFIKGTPIYTYFTEGCEKRRVSEEDVTSDIHRFSMQGVTKADQLRHSEMSDLLRTCKSAHDRGITWIPTDPEIPKTCKSSKKTSRKR